MGAASLASVRWMPVESSHLRQPEMAPDTVLCQSTVENHGSRGLIFPAVAHSERNLGVPLKTIDAMVCLCLE